MFRSHSIYCYESIGVAEFYISILPPTLFEKNDDDFFLNVLEIFYKIYPVIFLMLFIVVLQPVTHELETLKAEIDYPFL